MIKKYFNGFGLVLISAKILPTITVVGMIASSCGSPTVSRRSTGGGENNQENRMGDLSAAFLTQINLYPSDLIRNIGSTDWTASTGPANLAAVDGKAVTVKPNAKRRAEFVLYFTATQSQFVGASALRFDLTGLQS